MVSVIDIIFNKNIIYSAFITTKTTTTIKTIKIVVVILVFLWGENPKLHKRRYPGLLHRRR
jgi:hypothetical protein